MNTEPTTEKTHLNPLTEYIDYIERRLGEFEISLNEFFILLKKRRHFGKLPLELGQFIPCLNGKPLEKPNSSDDYYRDANGIAENYLEALKEFETALSKVLFEGWKVVEGTDTIQNGNIFIRFMKDNITDCTGYDPKITRFYAYSYTTIESIAHLKLILTKEGEKELT